MALNQTLRRMSIGRIGALALAGVLVLPAAAATQDAAAEPLPEAGTILLPGRYVSDAVGPTIEFRVEDGWIVGPAPVGPIFTLERFEQPGTVLTVTRFDGYTFLDSCDPTSLSTVEVSVRRLSEIIAGNPFLIPGPPRAADVDGHAGVELDIGVPAFTECSLGWLLLWALPIGKGGEFVQVADQQSRFLILDVEGDVIVIAIESFPGVPFGGLLDESMELVRSMRIEPGAYVPPEPVATPSPLPSPPPTPVAPASGDAA